MQSRTQHAKHIFILTVSHNAEEKQILATTESNSQDVCKRRSLSFQKEVISALICRYVTPLYANNYLIYGIWLEKNHLYGLHSNLSTLPNQNFNSFAPVGQFCLLRTASVTMHKI